MAELDRAAVAHEFGALAGDIGTITHALADIRARLARLEALFADPKAAADPLPEWLPQPPPVVEEPPIPQGVPVVAVPTPEEEHDEPPPGVAAGAPDPAPEPAAAEVVGEPVPPIATVTVLPVAPPVLPDLPEIEFPELYEWQRDALDAWREAGRVGVVEAVTGAGKTRVGLGAVAEALIDGHRAVVMAPTQGLVTQWAAQVAEFFPGVLVSTDAARSPGWHVLIDTVQTLAVHDPLWPGEQALLVADEAHRYGAPTFAQALRPDFTRRLGLSATVERGDEGDEALHVYFRGIPFRLGYDRALAERLIAPFRVAQLGVPLTPPERDEYDAASAGITHAWHTLSEALGRPAAGFVDVLVFAQRIAHRDHPAARSARSFLAAFAKRRDVLARVSAKVAALESLAPVVASSGGTIVFTGTTRSAEQAAEALARVGIDSAAVHGELGQGEVEERLELLRSGQTRSISAPRILDEGVDVPDADLGIILGASRTRRQMIQRLGRVVRKKADGHSARLVILYAIGTSEDPGQEEVPPHLAEILRHAEATAHLALPDDLDEALDFLGG